MTVPAIRLYRLPAIRHWAVGICGAVLVLLFLSSVAWGHAHVVESRPADGDVLPASPREIEIVFTEAIEAAASRLQLVDVGGNPVDATVQEAVDDTRLVLRVPELEPGSYTVLWSVMARDGHPTSGEIQFTVAPPEVEDAADGQETTTAPPPGTVDEEPADPAEPATGTPDGGSAGVRAPDTGSGRWPVFGIAAVALVLLVLVGRRRR